jgi:Uncharacterised protein family (UPF0158)
MPKAARLTDIIDGLEMLSDDNALSFFDRGSGEVTTASKDLLDHAEDCSIDEMPDIPDWQKDEWETVKRIASSKNVVPLPTKFDTHEWQILSDFANAVESPTIRAELLDSIHGAGAFRNFKAAVRSRGMEEEWYKFRAEALRQIAIEWCEENDIAFV